MSDILHAIENFIDTYAFYLTFGVLLLILFILISDIFVVAKVNKRIKKFEKKYSEPLKNEPVKSVPARDAKGRFVKR